MEGFLVWEAGTKYEMKYKEEKHKGHVLQKTSTPNPVKPSPSTAGIKRRPMSNNNIVHVVIYRNNDRNKRLHRKYSYKYRNRLQKKKLFG